GRTTRSRSRFRSRTSTHRWAAGASWMPCKDLLLESGPRVAICVVRRSSVTQSRRWRWPPTSLFGKLPEHAGECRHRYLAGIDAGQVPLVVIQKVVCQQDLGLPIRLGLLGGEV